MDDNKENKDNGVDNNGDNDVLLDFSALRKKINHFFSRKKADVAHASPSPSQEKISDFKQTLTWFKKNSKWLIPLVCILLAITTSVYLRTMPLRLPVSEDWAKSTVYNFYNNQLEQQIAQQYPNLPEQNKKAYLGKEWEKFKLENKQLIDSQIKQLSQQYKNMFRNENGTPYLLGIDPYHYYRQTGLILKNGFPGTEIKDGKVWDSYRLAPVGVPAEWNFHVWFAAYWHRFLNLFGNYPLMLTFFLVGTFFSALTVVPAFFIGRIITKNNAGGFFTAMLMAFIGFFVARTTGESSDTDVYSVFFPILIAWLFLESLEAPTLRKKIMWMSLAGFASGVFAFAWTGWWYIALFVIATTVIHLISPLIISFKKIKISQTLRSSVWKEELYAFVAYLASTALFVSLFASFDQFVRIFYGPRLFLDLKAVGVYSYWPNIRTTVAELNVPAFSNVIEQFDGKLLFTLAILGILLTFLRKNSKGEKWDFRISFFLALWFASAAFAATKGIRFILQLTPVFSLGLGALLGMVWLAAWQWTSKELKVPPLLSKSLFFLVLALLLIAPAKSGYSQAFHSVSSVNDGWYNALTKIKNEAPQNVIITSWWDFGHWFKAIADRPVTFDGGNQVGWGAHWVGKALLTNDEKLSSGIVHMLNCGQNKAFEELDGIFKDTVKEINLLNEIAVQDAATAIKTLHREGLTAEQIASVIKYTHCEDAPTDYFITSEDMIGKAGVWGHFGSWDFRRAVMYQKTAKLSRTDAEEYLSKNFNLSSENADRIYSEIQTTEADKWIAPWPGYLSGAQGCEKLSAQEIRCGAGVQGGNFAVHINTHDWGVIFEGNVEVSPNSLVYADKEGVHEKQFEGKKTGFSLVLLPDGENYKVMVTDPLLAASTFTKLFFFRGHGQKCFKKFDETDSVGGGKVIIWVVDYACQQENNVYFIPKQEVHAAHILISTQGRTEQEALAIIADLQKNVTSENFGTFAEKYSEDPGSKKQGGDLGWFGKGAMVPEFEQAAFALGDGKISEPVKTQFGYHLIFVKEKRES